MRKLLYIIWALLPALLSAQDWAYLSKITTHNGLVSNEVTSMLQDSKGFIWIGTDDGLHKFDGYDITVYTIAPRKTAWQGTLSGVCLKTVSTTFGLA